jgi:ribose transport system substrate-binding protein
VFSAPLFVCAALLIAACGSSSNTTSSSSQSSNSSGSSSSGTSSAGYTQAQADFKTFQTAQGLQGLTPVGKPIPSGKTIDFVVCGPAECLSPSTDFTKAATTLGWHVKVINGGLDPASNQAAMTQAVRDHPDAVIFEGLDSAVFQPQLAQLQAAKIPVIAWQTTDTPHPPNFLVIPGPTHYDLVTKMMAAAAMVATNGKPDVGFVSVPAFPIYPKMIDPKFKAAMKAYCPTCQIHEYPMPATALGKNATSLAVNFARSNSGINVLVMDQDSVSLGIGAQLKSAGLGSVKDIGLYPSSANLPNLTDGSEFALIPDPFLEMAYLDADALSRIFTGQSPVQDMTTTAPAAIWTKSNVPSTTTLAPTLSTYQSVFAKLWGK